MLISEHLVDWNVVGDNPAHPGEVTEGLEDITWEEIPHETTKEAIGEKSLAGYAATLSDPSVLLRVQCVEEGTSNEVIRPN